jgi:succinate dehydrogenase / fumarate reductase membrane anchor subunit
MSRRTPLGRVLGLGSAKDGVGHWWTQRTSAIALVPLGLWFAISLVLLASGAGIGYASVTAWIASPTHAVLLLLLLATACYHSVLGVQVVVEDYVELEWAKVASLLLSKFAHALLAAAGLYAVLRIAFAGSGA